MSSIRRLNVLGQMRLDAWMIRAIESGVAGDFDSLCGRAMCGTRSYVLKGFVPVYTGAVGNRASSLQLTVAGSIALHYNATDTGTVFHVPDDRPSELLASTNSRVTGSFTPSATNFVGIDLVSAPDDRTAALVAFWDPSSKTEFFRRVPTATTKDYQIYVSTTDFGATPTIAPVMKVVTDADNNVTSITDCRNLYFRLGSGGSDPDSLNVFVWDQDRKESATNPFRGGDRAIGDQKAWMDAVMTRLWELGGGERWSSSVSSANVKMVRSGTKFSNGEYFEWDGTHLHWRGLKFVFPNSTGWYNDVSNQTSDSSGLTNLASGECVYADLDFSANRTGGTAVSLVKGTTATLGDPMVPGSRYVVAWRSGSDVFCRDQPWAVGTSFAAATPTSPGVVKLSKTATDPADPVVLTNTERGAASGVVALDSSSRAEATGLGRSSGQGNGTISIGLDATRDQSVTLTADGGSGAGGALVVVDRKTYSSLAGGKTQVWKNGSFTAGHITNVGDLRLARWISNTGALTTEDQVTSFTTGSGFEDVIPLITGVGTVTPTGKTGGKQYDFRVKISTTGGRGAGQFQLSRDGGVSYGSAVTIDGSGVNTDSTSGLVLTFSNSTFNAGDVYGFRPRFTPQATYQDLGGRVRDIVDHNGFRAGRTSEFREEWMYGWSGVTSVPAGAGDRWTTTLAAGGSVTCNDANASFCSAYVEVGGTINSTEELILSLIRKPVRLEAHISTTWSWEMQVTSTSQTVQVGLRSGTTSSSNGAWFEKSGSNWSCKTYDGVTTNTGTTSYNTEGETGGSVARFQIELVGSSVGGGARTARFFINEELVYEHGSDLLVGPYTFVARTRSSANTNPCLIDLGPILGRWNRIDSATGVAL